MVRACKNLSNPLLPSRALCVADRHNDGLNIPRTLHGSKEYLVIDRPETADGKRKRVPLLIDAVNLDKFKEGWLICVHDAAKIQGMNGEGNEL